MAFRFIHGETALAQSGYCFRLGNSHHVRHLHAFASGAYRQNHIGAFFYHFSRTDAAVHDDSLFVFRAFLIFNFRREPQLQKIDLYLVLSFAHNLYHLDLFLRFFLFLGFFLLLSEKTGVKNPESPSHQEKYDTADEDSRHHR